MPNDAINPFILAVPQADLEDLNRRIDQTRWPDAETVDDWTGRPARQSQGADRSAWPPRFRHLANHHFFWRDHDRQLSIYRSWR
jgi:hypothetical protein